MNTIRDLKQQEKYTNMLKRKNKEKNIYKSKNSTLRIEKMNLIKAVERKSKEIERLNNRLKNSNDTCNYLRNIIDNAIDYIDRRDIEWGSEEHNKLLNILKGSEK